MPEKEKQQIPIIMSSLNQKEPSVRHTAFSQTVETITINKDAKRGMDKHDFESAMFFDDDSRRDLSLKSPEKQRINDLDDYVLSKLFYKARFFVIKSNNFENVHLAKKLSVWATPPANEKRLDNAFKASPNVFLVFSVRESGVFQGFARMRKCPDHDHARVPWALPPSVDPQVFGGIIKLDWLTRVHLPFLVCNDLRNPYNDNKEVKISRDGQELESRVGEQLCRLFPLDPDINVDKLVTSLNLDAVIEKYASNKAQSPVKEHITAKSRDRRLDRQKQRSSPERKMVSPPAEPNLIPQIFFDRLIELTNLPYEEYVAAVSNGRQINTLSKLGVYTQDSEHSHKSPAK